MVDRGQRDTADLTAPHITNIDNEESTDRTISLSHQSGHNDTTVHLPPVDTLLVSATKTHSVFPNQAGLYRSIKNPSMSQTTTNSSSQVPTTLYHSQYEHQREIVQTATRSHLIRKPCSLAPSSVTLSGAEDSNQAQNIATTKKRKVTHSNSLSRRTIPAASGIQQAGIVLRQSWRDAPILQAGREVGYSEGVVRCDKATPIVTSPDAHRSQAETPRQMPVQFLSLPFVRQEQRAVDDREYMTRSEFCSQMEAMRATVTELARQQASLTEQMQQMQDHILPGGLSKAILPGSAPVMRQVPKAPSTQQTRHAGVRSNRQRE